jgi:hypothetical protein
MPTWSLCDTEISGEMRRMYINLDNVLTVVQPPGTKRTMITMVGDKTVQVDNMPDEVVNPKKQKPKRKR